MQENRRHFLTRGLWLTAVLATGGVGAQAQSVVALPSYRADQVLQGLYGQHSLTLARSFLTEARALSTAARQSCADPAARTGLTAAWQRARLAWMALASPALGPLITRRSQRSIDFGPVRPRQLQQALDSQPRTLEQLQAIGGPAKGFPAIEQLLSQPASAASCSYLALLAEGIEAEARALTEGFEALGRQDWTADEEKTRSAFGEWINQWQGGLEQLRWQQIEQPLQKGRTGGPGQRPVFQRTQLSDNLADWRAEWAALKAQAGLSPTARQSPPVPGRDLVPIEALLLGAGQIELARRWADALEAASTRFDRLPPQPGEAQLLELARSLKTVASLYQSQVAGALDVSLGFSGGDGD